MNQATVEPDRHGNTFDLTVGPSSRLPPPVLFRARLWIAGGVIIIGLAISLTIINADRGFPNEPAIAVFLLAGILIMAVMWRRAGFGVSPPQALRVSEDQLQLEWTDRPRTIGTRWDNADLGFALFDRRGLPPIRSDGKPRAKFTLALDGAPRVHIPEPAFEAILAQAQAHRLRVSRQVLPGNPDPGSYVKIEVRGS